MNPLAWANTLTLRIAGRVLLMPWLGPSAIGLGILGTQSGYQVRRLKSGHHSRGWWLIPLVAWMPLVFWILSQFIPQY